LGEKIYWKIPNNYFSIMEAINKGLPVSDVNSNSNISNNFRDLATKMSDEIVEETILKNRI
jgi:MinD-like ATPase involved in chromosome partitioning or flagellar assembly